MTMWIRLTAIASLIVLAGCGFHLRGAFTLPESMDRVAVSPDDPYEPFQKALRRQLSKSGVTLVDESEYKTATTLVLSNKNISEHVIAQGANGPQRFQLVYSITYHLVAADGKRLQSPQTITRARDFSAGTNTIHSSNRERQVIEQELRFEIVSEMLRQLSTNSKAKAEKASLALESLPDDNSPC